MHYSSIPHSDAEERRRLFWKLYCHDKNVSLSLGRVANFRDDDVDTQIFVPSPDPGVRPWDEVAVNYIYLSRIQGKIFDELYALSSNKRTAEERNRSCTQLGDALKQWREKFPSVQSCRRRRWKLTLTRTIDIVSRMCTCKRLRRVEQCD